MELSARFVEHTGAVHAVRRPPQGGYYSVSLIEAEAGRFIIKEARTAELAAELVQESRVLQALEPYAPVVPRWLDADVAGGVSRFLFTCVDGQELITACQAADEAGRHALVLGMGQMLRTVHGWTPRLPYPQPYGETLLRQVEQRVLRGEVKGPISHSGQFGGTDPHEVLAWLKRWAAGYEPQVTFTHGDFCLPNVIAQGEQVVGVIDWSRGGFGEPRIDLAAGVWTIRYNLQDEAYVRSFLAGYGYDRSPESLTPYEALWVLC